MVEKKVEEERVKEERGGKEKNRKGRRRETPIHISGYATTVRKCQFFFLLVSVLH